MLQLNVIVRKIYGWVREELLDGLPYNLFIMSLTKLQYYNSPVAYRGFVSIPTRPLRSESGADVNERRGAASARGAYRHSPALSRRGEGTGASFPERTIERERNKIEGNYTVP